MILDALLKTKSRVVLMDIINKNGSFSFHCMRCNFIYACFCGNKLIILTALLTARKTDNCSAFQVYRCYTT